MKYFLIRYYLLCIIILIQKTSFGQQDTVRLGDSSLIFQKILSQHKYRDLGKDLLEDIDNTKDSIGLINAFYRADSLGKAYINCYPDKVQGYYIRVKAAEKADRDTSQGLALEPINEYIKFLEKDTTIASRKTICYNLLYLFYYYYFHAENISILDRYKKASNIADKIVQISPDHNDPLYIFARDFLDRLRTVRGVYGKKSSE